MKQHSIWGHWPPDLPKHGVQPSAVWIAWISSAFFIFPGVSPSDLAFVLSSGILMDFSAVSTAGIPCLLFTSCARVGILWKTSPAIFQYLCQSHIRRQEYEADMPMVRLANSAKISFDDLSGQLTEKVVYQAVLLQVPGLPWVLGRKFHSHSLILSGWTSLKDNCPLSAL